MKFILCLSVLSILFACAPEKTMNRKIDGSWNLVSINGSNLPANFTEKVTFTPEGRNGKIEFHIENNGKNSDSLGTYTIMKYEYITTSFKDNSKLGYQETVFTFTKCTSDELILTQQKAPSNVYYFKKI
jgi:hypothetical protein